MKKYIFVLLIIFLGINNVNAKEITFSEMTSSLQSKVEIINKDNSCYNSSLEVGNNEILIKYELKSNADGSCPSPSGLDSKITFDKKNKKIVFDSFLYRNRNDSRLENSKDNYWWSYLYEMDTKWATYLAKKFDYYELEDQIGISINKRQVTFGSGPDSPAALVDFVVDMGIANGDVISISNVTENSVLVHAIDYFNHSKSYCIGSQCQTSNDKYTYSIEREALSEDGWLVTNLEPATSYTFTYAGAQKTVKTLEKSNNNINSDQTQNDNPTPTGNQNEIENPNTGADIPKALIILSGITLLLIIINNKKKNLMFKI